MFWGFSTQSAVHGPAALLSPGNLLEMQNLSLPPPDLISLHCIKIAQGIGVPIKI